MGGCGLTVDEVIDAVLSIPTQTAYNNIVNAVWGWRNSQQTRSGRELTMAAVY